VTTQTAAPVVARTRDELSEARAGLTPGDVAVVMTMGALHHGHARLIKEARAKAAHVIVTIFLNPLQFGPREDLSRYPRTFDDDMEICTREGVDIVFAPTPDVVYPDGDPGVRISAGPPRWARCSRARPGPATSTACSPWSASCCTSPAPAAPTSARRTPSSCC
jgi:pantoate--beta-alanine ligase